MACELWCLRSFSVYVLQVLADEVLEEQQKSAWGSPTVAGRGPFCMPFQNLILTW